MNNSRRPVYINIIILSLVTVVVWIIYSVYSTLSSPTVINIPPESLENFDARLDADALSKLQQSIYLTESELVESVSVAEPEPEETAEEVETETEEEEIPADESAQP